MCEFDMTNKAERCAKEIIDWLLSHYLWVDVAIYANGKCFSDYDGKYHYENTPDCVFVREYLNVDKHFEYTGDFLFMTFEGDLYNIMNFCDPYCDTYINEFNAILKKYGKYYEMGYDWSLALYDI